MVAGMKIVLLLKSWLEVAIPTRVITVILVSRISAFTTFLSYFLLDLFRILYAKSSNLFRNLDAKTIWTRRIGLTRTVKWWFDPLVIKARRHR
jgi:hypothetical protein